MNDIQAAMVQQFDGLAPRSIDYRGRRYARSRTTLIVNDDTVRFQFLARKRTGEWVPCALGVEVAYDHPSDTYRMAVTCFDERGFLTLGNWSDVYFDDFREVGEWIARASTSAAGEA